MSSSITTKSKLLEYVEDLMFRVKGNIKTFNGNKYLSVYLIDEFFNLVSKNWIELRYSDISKTYLELQKIIVDDILLEIIVGGVKGNLYNSTMTYNATCTEEDLHYFYNIPYGGDGDLEHLNIHTGYGKGVSDLVSKQEINIAVLDEFDGRRGHVTVGPNFEVKDYKDKNSAESYFKKDAETTVYHDSNHVFIHLLDCDDYYIAANKKDSKWYRLLGVKETITHYRKQVILWIDNEGFLQVRFR